jgi:hypothetical protein
MHLKKSLFTLPVWCLLLPQAAWAADGSGPVPMLTILISLLAIGLALGCFFLAWRIYSFLKGGELALSWQMLGLSFFLLGLAQLLETVSQSGWLALTPVSVSFARVVALAVLAFGLHRTAKILS